MFLFALLFMMFCACFVVCNCFGFVLGGHWFALVWVYMFYLDSVIIWVTVCISFCLFVFIWVWDGCLVIL